MKPSAQQMSDANDPVVLLTSVRVLCHIIRQELEGNKPAAFGVGLPDANGVCPSMGRDRAALGKSDMGLTPRVYSPKPLIGDRGGEPGQSLALLSGG
jgi:hypothetical protein